MRQATLWRGSRVIAYHISQRDHARGAWAREEDWGVCVCVSVWSGQSREKEGGGGGKDKQAEVVAEAEAERQKGRAGQQGSRAAQSNCGDASRAGAKV